MTDIIYDNSSLNKTASHYILISSLIVAAIVCFAQVKGSFIILILGLMLFLALSVWAGFDGCSLQVLLFFLPWSPLIKLHQGSFALFTFALMLICIICLVRNGLNLEKYQIVVPALLVIETLIAKLIQENSISNSYLFFMVMLVLFPCVMDRSLTDCSFYEATVFFASGIISAALTAQRIAIYPSVSAYITVDSFQLITRLSGFYGDPNFYAAQITACIAGIQLLLIKETERKRRLLLAGMALLLFYCGMLSASKAFVIVLATMLLLWTVIILDKDNRGTALFRIMIGMAVAAVIILSSSEFTRLFQIITERFSFSANASQITTHRTDLWLMYLDTLSRDPLLALFGQGFTNININGRASHNTLIQGVYQFGIIGFPLLFVWMKLSISKLMDGLGLIVNRKCFLLIAAGVLMPWLSLDILFFDEFFILPFYAGCAVMYSSTGKNEIRQTIR